MTSERPAEKGNLQPKHPLSIASPYVCNRIVLQQVFYYFVLYLWNRLGHTALAMQRFQHQPPIKQNR